MARERARGSSGVSDDLVLPKVGSELLMRATMVLRKRKAVLRDDGRDDDVDDGRDDVMAMSRKTENGREIVPKIDLMDRSLRTS